MALYYTWSALWKILNRVLNWWRLMLVPKLKPRIKPLSYWTTSIEFQESIPTSAKGQLCASLTIPAEIRYGQKDGIIQKCIRLQEESKESTKRIMTVENDIECIKLELAKMQTEWQYKWQQSPTEWNGTSGQPHVECREPTMKERDLDLPCKAAAQAQNLTCQLRRDCAMNDEVDYTCNFLPQFDEGSQTELMPFLNEPADKHCITAVPFCSLPFGSTQFTSLRSFSSFRSGSLLNRFKADLKSNQPLKAYAPRTIFDLKIGLRVKIILPTGKIGTGVLKYIGMLPGVPEVCFGVELQFPENGLRNGTFAGHCYFHCSSSGHHSVPGQYCGHCLRRCG